MGAGSSVFDACYRCIVLRTEEQNFFEAMRDKGSLPATAHENRDIREAMAMIERHPSILRATLPWSAASTPWHAAALKDSVELLRFMADFMLTSSAVPIPSHFTNDERRGLLKDQLNTLNVNGHTPLMIAAARGHIDCILFLIENGASVIKAEPTMGLIPLHFAARAGKPESIRAILDNLPPQMSFFDQEILKDIPSASGLTALHFAVGFGHVGCVEALLSYKASQTARTRAPTLELGCLIGQGSTPLHVSAHLVDLPAAASLLSSLAVNLVITPSTLDPRLLQNSAGLIPLRMAERSAKITVFTLNKSRANIDLLCEILRPSTNLMLRLDVKLPDLGPPTLAVIAAAAMRRKLLGDLDAAAEVTMFKRASTSQHQTEEYDDDDEGQKEEDEVDCRENSRSQGLEEVLEGPGGSAIAKVTLHPLPVPLTKSSSLSSFHIIKGSASRFARVSANAIHPEPIHGPEGSSSMSSGSSRMSRLGKRKASSQALKKRATDEEEDEACFICLDASPEVGVAGCRHKLCKSCASQMIEKKSTAPLTCPFCRISVSNFVSLD